MTDVIRQYRPNTHYKMVPTAFWNQRDVRSIIAGFLGDPRQTKVGLPIGVLDGFKAHNPIHDSAKAVLQLQYAYRYSVGEIEVPEEFDPNSF